jgi:hypothetical protein
MKLFGIFKLGKREQRVVILIVVVLVVLAFARHWSRTKSQSAIHTQSTTTPTIPPTIHSEEDSR